MATFIPDTSNEIFQLAIQLVNQSNQNIFLTGKAGTGKTTFLKHICSFCHKQMAIVAPTGVAAINAGGVTLHSFFQLPLSPFIPETKGGGFPSGGEGVSDKHSLISRLRYNREKRKILQQLELLIVDEISMVRCDILDAMDTILKHVRQRPNEPFGGVQLLFIGDMFQLPPVVRDDEWKILSAYYRGPYFFDSQVLTETPVLCVEFNKIYRQKDEQFIHLLNQVRNNQLDETGTSVLESRYNPSFRRSKQDGYIVLTTHNNKASDINSRELSGLNSAVSRFDAETEGDFSERAFPADEVLYLKEGAQVMFIRNDPAERGKRFYNGKIGTVTRLEDSKIFVTCQDEQGEIEVQREKWENIRYTVNKSTSKLESEVLGSFTQHPLRLAWAITIHKSQGLTFEKAIIDAGEAFSPGQVYVALSRCTSLDGIVLKSHIRTNSVVNDPRIVEFAKKTASNDELKNALAAGSKKYQEALLLAVFYYDKEVEAVRDIQTCLQEHGDSFNTEAAAWIGGICDNMVRLKEIAAKFVVQLRTYFVSNASDEQGQALQQRIKAAAGYFTTETETVAGQIRQSPVVTDSKLHSKEFNELMKDLFVLISEKQFLTGLLKEGYNPDLFMKHRSGFVVPAFSVNAYGGVSASQPASAHPVLHQQLRVLRDSICAKKNQPIYLVASSKTLDELTRYLPQNCEELKSITGFGTVKIENYGQQFTDIIVAYCVERGLASLIHEKDTKQKQKQGTKSVKGETFIETLRLFREGKTIDEIAKERKLAVGTIEAHFARLAGNGEIDAKEFIGSAKYALIESALTEAPEKQTLSTIKESLGEDISFGEIRMVIASLGISKSIGQ